eukprot:6321524-Amphidinium_carterae.1
MQVQDKDMDAFHKVAHALEHSAPRLCPGNPHHQLRRSDHPPWKVTSLPPPVWPPSTFHNAEPLVQWSGQHNRQTRAAMGRPSIPYATNEVLQILVIGLPKVSDIQITELIKKNLANLAIRAGTTQMATAIRALQETGWTLKAEGAHNDRAAIT